MMCSTGQLPTHHLTASTVYPDNQAPVPSMYSYILPTVPMPASFYLNAWYGNLNSYSFQTDNVYDSAAALSSSEGSYSPPSGINLNLYTNRPSVTYPTDVGKRNCSLMSCNSSPESTISPGSSRSLGSSDAESPLGSKLTQPYSWTIDVKSHINAANKKDRTRTKDKYRVVYTEKQKVGLEKAYKKNTFITAAIKMELSKSLSLSERQIKIWFQNRRAKERKLRVRKEKCDTVKDTIDTATWNIEGNVTPGFPSCCQTSSQNQSHLRTISQDSVHQTDVIDPNSNVYGSPDNHISTFLHSDYYNSFAYLQESEKSASVDSYSNIHIVPHS